MPEPRPSEQVLDAVAALLQRARSVLFITGAGMSADSGLPTYRGIGGLYEGQSTEDGLPIEAALSARMLSTRPAVCWKYIAQIEAACRGARHNRGHARIAAFERKIPRTWVLTQNVDGFHRDAGSQNVIEIHGNVHHLRCTRCSWRATVADYSALTLPPACPACAALVRPEVVLFGERLPAEALALYDRELDLGFDLVVTIGTTSVFPYIAGPVLDASAAGTPTVEINPGTSEVSDFITHKIPGRAADSLEQLWRRSFGA